MALSNTDFSRHLLLEQQAFIKHFLQNRENCTLTHLTFPATEDTGTALTHFTDVEVEAEGTYITCTSYYINSH
jgi:hypothetical protein